MLLAVLYKLTNESLYSIFNSIFKMLKPNELEFAEHYDELHLTKRLEFLIVLNDLFKRVEYVLEGRLSELDSFG